MKYAKLIFFSIIILIAIISYGYFFLCSKNVPDDSTTVIVDNWTKPLQNAGYKHAVITKPDHIPGDKLPPVAETVLYTEGTVKDSLSVEVSVVTTPEGTAWVKTVIDGEQVKFNRVEYAQMPIPSQDNDWSLLVHGAWINGVDTGLGLAWDPVQFSGSRIGLETIIDLNPGITTAPDWFAVNGRISRRMGAFSLGAGLGYRFGEESGLAVGVDVGLAIGL